MNDKDYRIIGFIAIMFGLIAIVCLVLKLKGVL